MLRHTQSLPDGLPPRLGGWVLGAPLGSGAMGAVFSARHAKSGQQAAIKLAAAGTEPGRLLHEEALALAGCEHRGVVQIHDHGEDHGIVWLALQLVDGETLREWIARRFGPDDAAPLSKAEVRTAVGWMRDLASALHAMHRRGVLHRDVKPANLMLSRDGEARVIDLGLAIDLDGEPVATLAGTAPYMSPEQVLAAALVDARSDVYSLAASFYEVLSGWAVARGRGSLASMLQDVAFVEAPRLSARVPNALPGLDAVFAKALAKSPAIRYPDAGALAEDLERVLDGQLPKWARETAAVRWRRRVPGIAAVAVVAVVLAWFGVGWWADRVAMAEFRSQCAAARGATRDMVAGPKLAIDALQTALRLQQRFAGVQEFEDLYGAALAELAPGLTRWMFQKAALSTTAGARLTETGIVGDHAARHLATKRQFSHATQIELAVQAAFGHVRAMQTKEAKAVLEPLLATARPDERVVSLHAMATLWDAWDAERGELKDRAAYERVVAQVGRAGFDYANLKSVELCVRAMLLLEVAEVAAQVPEAVARGASSSALLQAALVAIEAPLEKELVEAARSREAGNYVACLLALVRLRIDKPAAAREVLELRLGSNGSEPEQEEWPAMAMFSAAAGFRALVREVAPEVAESSDKVNYAYRIDAVKLSAVVARFASAVEVDPGLASRFLTEVGRAESLDGHPNRVRFEVVSAAFLEAFVEARLASERVPQPLLRMACFCTDCWWTRGSLSALLRLADLAAQSTDIEPSVDVQEECATAVFWICAINVCGFPEVSMDVDRRLALANSFRQAAVAMSSRMNPFLDLAVLRVQEKLGVTLPTAEAQALVKDLARKSMRQLAESPDFSSLIEVVTHLLEQEAGRR